MLADDNNGTPYTRGGHLNEIRYGQRADALFSATPSASNKVVFGYAERCTTSDCGSLTDATRDNWPTCRSTRSARPPRSAQVTSADAAGGCPPF